MPTDFAFRLSTYLTLGLSCLCLGYSSWDLLPEAAVVAGLVLVLLAVSFRTGSRYELDLQSANRVGLVIGILAVGWMAYQFANKNSLIYTLPWPASLLPYLGLLLMVLMPAKLFRPKHVGDWWAMQGIGLASVALASSMAEDEVFGLLLGFYAVAGVASLTLFFYRRSAGTLPAVPHTDPGPTPELVTAGSPWTGRRVAWWAVGWLALAVAVGLPFFFLTPRSNAPRWQYGKAREIGLTSDQMVDLTRTGELRASREIAFRVRTTYPDGRPKEDISPGQRWRAFSFNHYEGGRWVRSDLGGRLVAALTSPGKVVNGILDYSPPDLGAGQYRLDFTPGPLVTEVIVSDPIIWEAGKTAPVATLVGTQMRAWFHVSDGEFQPLISAAKHPILYRQYTRPFANTGDTTGDPNLGTPFELVRRPPPVAANVGTATPLPATNPRGITSTPVPVADVEEPTLDPLTDPGHPVARLRTVRPARIKFWTRDLLERLAVSDDQLRSALGRADTRRDLQIAPQDYEPVARALSDYLAGSGEFKYTLTLRREDPGMDPVEEFLTRTKEGHCQRFAAGLALMLRSIGIPANYVLGFKGCEYEGDGNYVIRQDHAHAWVEVLVIRPTPPGFRPENPPEVVYHWLSLDPTPDGGSGETGGLGGWFGTARETWAGFFQNFIVGYNRDRREQTVATARDWLIRGGWVVVGLLAVVALVLVARPGLGRRQRRTDPDVRATGYDWYDRLTGALAEGGYPPAPGSTPREYATSASAALAARPGVETAADVPLSVTLAFYLARYAGRPPNDEELARLDADIARLQAVLRDSPRPSREGSP
jgi:transglutaminase-like putative cysteine protease